MLIYLFVCPLQGIFNYYYYL